MTGTVHLLGLREGPDGGLERYGRWLAGRLAAAGRLDPGGLTFGLRARAGGEVVRTADGCSAEWVAACGRLRWRWAAYVARERAAVARARRVVAISPMVADELARHYGRRDAAVLLNPVFAPAAEPAPAAREGLVFVGHDFHRKGLDLLLEALRQLPDRTVHVLGADRRLAGWRRRAAGLPVRFHGAVEAAPWIAGAALLVHPARYEPYGNVIAEAVAAGTPAVASDGCGAACLLDPGHVWPRAAGPAALAATIRAALRAPRPPRLRPPDPEAHLAALDEVWFG